MRRLIFYFLVGLVSQLHMSDAKIGTFWHISDIHLDHNFTRKGDADKMCRGQNPSGQLLGLFGDYKCDSPWQLVESALNAMESIEADPDFIFWTGDNTAHVSDSLFSTDQIQDVLKNLTDAIRYTFPQTNVFAVLGNNDYYPANQIPPEENEITTSAADMWQDWFQTTSSYRSFRKHGYYEEDIPNTSLTVVGINTNLWYTHNHVTGSDPDVLDPGNHFQWIDDVLSKVARRNRKAYLIGHISPGVYERSSNNLPPSATFYERYHRKYHKLLQDHAEVIVGQFYGHSHSDMFRVVYREETSTGEKAERIPVSWMMLVGAITPWEVPTIGGNNPSVRLFHYDTNTGEILEASTYYLDLAAANDVEKAVWKFEYNFTTQYNLDSISPEQLHLLAQKIKNDEETFKIYHSANTAQQQNGPCDEACHTQHFCAITEVDIDRFAECYLGAAPKLSTQLSLIGILLFAVNLLS